MTLVTYEYVGFVPDIETGDHSGVTSYPSFVDEIKSVLPAEAEWGQENNSVNNDYYGVKFGNHFMYVLYDNPAIVFYNSETEKEWGQVVEAVLNKMNAISMKLFGEPSVLPDEDEDY